MSNKIDIAIPTKIISKYDEVRISISSFNNWKTTYILKMLPLPNNSVALLLCPKKDNLVITPNRHNSHTT